MKSLYIKDFFWKFHQNHYIATYFFIKPLLDIWAKKRYNNNIEKNKKKVRKMKKKVLFISSTGGHLNELMQLAPLFEKYEYYIITEKDEASKALKEKYKEKISYLPYGTRTKIFSYIFKYFYLCIKTIYYYIKIRPKVIITTGTHTAGPMCYLGKIFGSKIIYIETFANRDKKTATGRLIYPIADLFIVQWKEMLKLYPKAVYGGSIYKWY